MHEREDARARVGGRQGQVGGVPQEFGQEEPEELRGKKRQRPAQRAQAGLPDQPGVAVAARHHEKQKAEQFGIAGELRRDRQNHQRGQTRGAGVVQREKPGGIGGEVGQPQQIADVGVRLRPGATREHQRDAVVLPVLNTTDSTSDKRSAATGRAPAPGGR